MSRIFSWSGLFGSATGSGGPSLSAPLLDLCFFHISSIWARFSASGSLSGLSGFNSGSLVSSDFFSSGRSGFGSSGLGGSSGGSTGGGSTGASGGGSDGGG